MEILMEGKEMADFVFQLVFIGYVAVLFGAFSVSFFVDWLKKRNNKSEVKFGSIVCGLIALLFMFLGLSMYNDGATEYYKVKITDFNEVFEQGYEIVDQEGKIYKIVKSD